MGTRRCAATNRHGQPCQAPPLTGKDRCLAHDEEARGRARFGGPQPGSGRPKNPRAVDVLRERLEANIDRVLDPLFDALDAKRSVVVGNGPGAYVETVEDVPTQLAAIREILDRSYGRPRQAIEHSGPDRAPIQAEMELTPEAREALADVLRRRPAAGSQ